MNITNPDEDGKLICKWFQERFPNVINISKGDLLEILTDLLVSTKNNRYGPIPSPEHLVTIRNTIRKSIELDHPIPILTGWGGRKADSSSSIDVAEVSAITQILNLDTEIRKFYSPGLMVNIRVEDTNAEWLYRNDPDTKAVVNQYSTDFKTLISILQPRLVINPIRESSLMEAKEYFSTSRQYSDLLFKVLTIQKAFPGIDLVNVPEYTSLLEYGWKGDIPVEQREYYLSRYSTLYPGRRQEDYLRMLADYFGGSKARYDLNGRAEPVTPVGSHIQLTFVPTIPGAPTAIFGNAVYWRTIPANQGRTHIAPWRAKGYFKINGDIVSKITSFNDPMIEELITSFTLLKDGNAEVEVRTDYMLVDE